VDEIGYLPIDRHGANLFFQLISRRYERGPMILTSNQSFGSWGEVFGDRIIATAILDRILHHAITLNIRGNSYQLKDKLKAGLVRPAEATLTLPDAQVDISEGMSPARGRHRAAQSRTRTRDAIGGCYRSRFGVFSHLAWILPAPRR
jgi:hypothetical protein